MNTIENLSQKEKFDAKIKDLRATRMFSDSEYKEFIENVKRIRTPGHRMSPSDFYLVKRFEVMQVEKNGELVEKLVKPGTNLRFATFEKLFDIIKDVHEEGSKHGCRDILNKKLQKLYANISVKQIQAFVDCCEVCQIKKGRLKKGVVVKPIVTSDMNKRCQVDCIDMQSNPDGDFRYIMVYQVTFYLKSILTFSAFILGSSHEIYLAKTTKVKTCRSYC